MARRPLPSIGRDWLFHEACITHDQRAHEGHAGGMAVGLDSELAWSRCSSPIPAAWQHMEGLGPETGGVRALSDSAGEVWFAKSSASSSQQGMPAQQVSWRQSFADPWDKRQSKLSPLHPDFKHTESKLALRLKNAYTLDSGMKKTPESVSTSGHGQRDLATYEGQLEVGMCRKLCEDGRASDAVNALRLLVQRRCHVPTSLFYRVLQSCITHKDLVSGQCIHALIVKSGYQRDAFLAIQLTRLYASHGMLEEAMRVFTEVSTPNAYNWATIILAYARHGGATGAAEAIRLYRQMRESTTIKPDNRIYSAVLKAVATAGDLVAGKEIHAHILASPGKPDAFVQAGLVDMYAKCGSLEDARRVFDRLRDRNVVTWTAMIAGYAQRGMGQEALGLYNSMQQEGLILPNTVTYLCGLQACASVGAGALFEGKQLHEQIKGRGLQQDVVLGGSLVNMYAKCGSLEDARILFDKLPDRNVITWNAMFAGYAQQGMAKEALSLYSSMQNEGIICPNCVTYACLLQACAYVGVGALHEGKQLHAQIDERGLQGDVVLGGSLVNMYAKCGTLEDARRLFEKLPKKNVVAWTVMLAGYAQQGMGQKALSLYSSMKQEGLSPPDCVTFVCLLQACATVGVGAFDEGKQLHYQIKERGMQEDVLLGGCVVNMYAKCGTLEDARSIFNSLPKRDVGAWTAMIAGYAQKGMGQEALSLYSSMQEEGLTPPNSVTYVCLLQACASAGVESLRQGKQLHEQIKERGLQDDVVVGGSLVNMYAKCGSLEYARQLFDRLPERNVVTWNAMIAGYLQQGMDQEALTLYKRMEQEGLFPPDSVTFACLLQACASVGRGALDEGKQLHALIKERGVQEEVILGSSLVTMYAKCGRLDNARQLFNRLPERTVVAWTAMIAGYVQQGMSQEALSLYSSMQEEGLILADSVTYACLLQACAVVAALLLGKHLHAEIEERGMQGDVVVGAALINMYAKCGSMFCSQCVFDSLPERNVEAWGALIGGYACQGDSEVVFNLLDRMILEGIQPDGITFLSVLTVCSHTGLVEKGRKYFEAMRTDFGITPTIDHFTCMIDLLGRAGHLVEALQMARNMPVPPNGAVWLSLLSASQKWNNVEIGQQAFEFAVMFDGKDATSYVLMSNIYASAEMWEEAKEMHARRKKFGARKKPGQSWTDVGGVVHTFVAGKSKHFETGGVNAGWNR